jgi:hypothetical protein
MRYLATTVAINFLLCTSPVAVHGQSTCHTADDNSSRVIYILNRIMASDLSAGRDSLGLPLVSPSEVTLVTDSVVCARAGQATDSLVRVWNPTTQVPPNSTNPLYVFKIGTSYGVLDLNSPNEGAHYLFLLFFGALWNYSSMITL